MINVIANIAPVKFNHSSGQGTPREEKLGQALPLAKPYRTNMSMFRRSKIHLIIAATYGIPFCREANQY